MKKILALFRIFISAGLLFMLFWIMRKDVSHIWISLSESNVHLLWIALVLIVFNIVVLAYRMKVIFLGEDLKITLREAVELTLIGCFFNNFMPTAVGGDIIKAHYAANANKERLRSYASVLMDRFIGLYTFLVVAAVALVIDKGRLNVPSIRTLVFILLFLGVMGVVIVTNGRVARRIGKVLLKIKMLKLGEKLGTLYGIVHDYRNRGKVVVSAFLVSILAQIFYFMMVYVFFAALGKEAGINNIFLIMPVVVFISMLPSVGGIGVREGAMVAFFTPITGRETAFAVSLLGLFSLLLVSFAGGIIYLVWSISGIKGKERICR